MSEKESSITPQHINNDDSSVAFKQRTYGIIRRLLVGFIIVSLANGAFAYIFYTPKAYRIESDRRNITEQLQLLERRVDAAYQQLEAITYRDNNIYRPLFGLDTLKSMVPLAVDDRAYELIAEDSYSHIIDRSNDKIDIFAQNLYTQSLSFDKLQLLAKDKQLLANAIPALWPIDRTLLNWGGRPYGMRFHPIYKRYIMHNGIDLASSTGAPIYATADGVVVTSEQGYRTVGYGQMIMIDHGFGYKTRYGHMSKRNVVRGDSVKRGDVIGLVGSTGGSTGPHLHYEVIIKNKTVDPVNFFDRNMSKEEYRELKDRILSGAKSDEDYY